MTKPGNERLQVTYDEKTLVVSLQRMVEWNRDGEPYWSTRHTETVKLKRGEGHVLDLTQALATLKTQPQPREATGRFAPKDRTL